MNNPAPAEVKSSTIYCSFCGKSQHEVRRLIAGPQVYICDECSSLCDDIIFEGACDGKLMIRIKGPVNDALDEYFYKSLNDLLFEKYPELEAKFEYKTIYSEGRVDKNSPFFIFTCVRGSETQTNELKKALSTISVLQSKYLVENERVKNLQTELDEIKIEYIDYIRSAISEKKNENRLMSIMFIDIKGFSQFEAVEKHKTLDLVRGLVPTLMSRRGGRQINTWGDGIVAAFEDVNDSLSCAVKFLRHLSVEALEARIGMAWGPVNISYNPAIGRADIEGAAVDRAARLEPLASPGEILLSSEYEGHPLDKGLGTITKTTVEVKKPFANFVTGDKIDVLKLRVLLN